VTYSRQNIGLVRKTLYDIQKGSCFFNNFDSKFSVQVILQEALLYIASCSFTQDNIFEKNIDALLQTVFSFGDIAHWEYVIRFAVTVIT